MQPETHGTHARSVITMACTGAAVAGQTKITIHRRRPGDAHRYPTEINPTMDRIL